MAAAVGKVPEPVDDAAEGLIRAVHTELAAMGLLDTVQGRTALTLAHRFNDALMTDSGGAVAALVRELITAMQRARASAPPPDETDALRATVLTFRSDHT